MNRGTTTCGANPISERGGALRLERGVVHVWIAHLDVDPAMVSSLLNLLSGEERVRAARLRTTQSRLRFIVAHGVLRSILSYYLDSPPAVIRFENTPSGKPCVAGTPVMFNLSHSDELAVVAVTAHAEIGVDVEKIRPMVDLEDFVKRFFSSSEVQAYASMPSSDRSATFFSTWTRKEAFVKAKGLELQQPLNSFEVEVAPDVTSPRLIVLGESQPELSYTLRSFTPHDGYAAAVALDGEIEAMELFDWDDSGGRSRHDALH